jgi:hypothetical protein
MSLHTYGPRIRPSPAIAGCDSCPHRGRRLPDGRKYPRPLAPRTLRRRLSRLSPPFSRAFSPKKSKNVHLDRGRRHHRNRGMYSSGRSILFSFPSSLPNENIDGISADGSRVELIPAQDCLLSRMKFSCVFRCWLSKRREESAQAQERRGRDDRSEGDGRRGQCEEGEGGAVIIYFWPGGSIRRPAIASKIVQSKNHDDEGGKRGRTERKSLRGWPRVLSTFSSRI